MQDIRANAKRALEDERAVRDELLQRELSQTAQQQRAQRAALKAAEKRQAELERLIPSLYEDKVSGVLPEATFKSLLTRYEAEREETVSTVQELTRQTSEAVRNQANIDTYIANIRKYVSVEQLDREMLLELIRCINVGEVTEENGQKKQEIAIHYNLIDKAG